MRIAQEAGNAQEPSQNWLTLKCSTPKPEHGWIYWATIFLASTQALSIAPLFPSLQAQLSLETTDLGLLTGGYSACYTCATLIAFAFFSHLSPIRLLRWGLICLGLCNLVIFGFEEREAFIALRLLSAFPHAFLLPAILTRMGQTEVTKSTFRKGGWVLSGHGAAHLLGVPLLLLLIGLALKPTLTFSLSGCGLLILGIALPQKSTQNLRQNRDSRIFLKGWRELWNLQSARFVILGAFCITAALSAFVYVFPSLHAQAKGIDESALAAWIFAAGAVQVSMTYLGGHWASEKGIRLVVMSAIGIGLIATILMASSGSLGGSTAFYGISYLLCVAASSLRYVPLSIGLLQQMPQKLHFGSSTALSAFHQAGRGAAGLISLLLLAGNSITALALVMVLLLSAAGSLIASIQVPISK